MKCERERVLRKSICCQVIRRIFSLARLTEKETEYFHILRKRIKCSNANQLKKESYVTQLGMSYIVRVCILTGEKLFQHTFLRRFKYKRGFYC